ncbi:hypothetical protein BDV06DRAFT_215008 [Aspergillus oleicola]
MSKEQTPKFALITGCGQGGIGEALVREFLRRNVHPIATLLPSESSEHLSAAGITWFPLDVTKEESVLQLKENIVGLTGGRLDVLVNNAFVCYTMPAIDTDVAAVQRMFDVNLFGPMRMVHHFHDLLIQAAGTIVSIGSIGGVTPYVFGSSYNASKAALAHWGNTLRVISGEVGTNILKNDHGRELPKDSYFAPLASEFKNHVHRTPATTDRFTYASNVVKQALAASPPAWFWTGSLTSTVRFLDAFFPRTIFKVCYCDLTLWGSFASGFSVLERV